MTARRVPTRKSALILLLLSALIAFLSACSGGGEVDDKSTPTAQPAVAKEQTQKEEKIEYILNPPADVCDNIVGNQPVPPAGLSVSPVMVDGKVYCLSSSDHSDLFNAMADRAEAALSPIQASIDQGAPPAAALDEITELSCNAELNNVIFWELAASAYKQIVRENPKLLAGREKDFRKAVTQECLTAAGG